MTTFKGTPNLLVRLHPHVGNIRHIRFDENGEYATDNRRLVKRLGAKFEAVEEQKEIFACKKCDFTTDNKGLLMSHYRQNHKEDK